ncbi:hypothetical protein [Romboutsia weinsteinii]|nr:hypothetical protein [Romboutsia weinsteinii]
MRHMTIYECYDKLKITKDESTVSIEILPKININKNNYEGSRKALLSI